MSTMAAFLLAAALSNVPVDVTTPSWESARDATIAAVYEAVQTRQCRAAFWWARPGYNPKVWLESGELVIIRLIRGGYIARMAAGGDGDWTVAASTCVAPRVIALDEELLLHTGGERFVIHEMAHLSVCDADWWTRQKSEQVARWVTAACMGPLE